MRQRRLDLGQQCVHNHTASFGGSGVLTAKSVRNSLHSIAFHLHITDSFTHLQRVP